VIILKITAEVKKKKPLDHMQTGAWSGMELTLYGLYSFETGQTVMAGHVLLYRFPLHPQHLYSLHQPGHPAHPDRAEAPGPHRLPEDVPLRIELDSFVTDGFHGFYVSFLLLSAFPRESLKQFIGIGVMMNMSL
jgi:hypothetical protein